MLCAPDITDVLRLRADVYCGYVLYHSQHALLARVHKATVDTAGKCLYCLLSAILARS